LKRLLDLVVKSPILCELVLRLDGNCDANDNTFFLEWQSQLSQTLVERGWSTPEINGHLSIFRRKAISGSLSFWAHAANVNDFAVGKYLGDHIFVKSRFPSIGEEFCIGVQSNYGVQIIAVEHINGSMEWFPAVATCFERNDVVYYVPVGDDESDGFKKFQSEFVHKHTDTVVEMNAVEFTPRLNGRPAGAPEHLDNFVIGGKQHRTSEEQGALYLRNTFAGIAIHVILRPDGTVVKFPGPKQVLQKGDRFFMLGGICNDPSRTGPQLKPEDVAKMMDRDKFYNHISRMTAPNVWPDAIRVQLPAA